MSRGTKLLISLFSIGFFYILGGLMAVGVLLMIALHELGHLYAAKRLGYPTGGFFLTPLGGLAIIKGRIINLTDRFVISLAGPVVGALLSTLALGVYCFWNNEFILKMGKIWALVNLMNLLPIFFLDGGQVWWCIGNSITTKYGFKHWFLIPTWGGLLIIFSIFGLMPIVIWGLIFFGLGLHRMVKREIWSLRENIPMNAWEIYLAELSYLALVFELGVLTWI